MIGSGFVRKTVTKSLPIMNAGASGTVIWQLTPGLPPHPPTMIVRRFGTENRHRSTHDHETRPRQQRFRSAGTNRHAYDPFHRNRRTTAVIVTSPPAQPP